MVISKILKTISVRWWKCRPSCEFVVGKWINDLILIWKKTSLFRKDFLRPELCYQIKNKSCFLIIFFLFFFLLNFNHQIHLLENGLTFSDFCKWSLLWGCHGLRWSMYCSVQFSEIRSVFVDYCLPFSLFFRILTCHCPIVLNYEYNYPIGVFWFLQQTFCIILFYKCTFYGCKLITIRKQLYFANFWRNGCCA